MTADDTLILGALLARTAADERARLARRMAESRQAFKLGDRERGR